MKNLITILFLALFASAQFSSYAQAPGKFNYQAVIRDANGAVLANSSLILTFKIYTNAVGTGLVYQEMPQNVNTSPNGIINYQIGSNPASGFSLANINWGAGSYYIDILNGTASIFAGTYPQLVSVPYALYANKADTAKYALYAPQTTYTGTNGITVSGTNISATFSGVPVGTILPFAGPVANIPAGYIVCDGNAISRTSGNFAPLFAAIGTSWGIGDGVSTFNLPDLRGMFLRGIDDVSGNDPDAGSRTALHGGNSGSNVGSYQSDAFASHNHAVTTQTNGSGGGGGYFVSSFGTTATSVNTGNTGASAETRPKNAYVIYIIKLFP